MNREAFISESGLGCLFCFSLSPCVSLCVCVCVFVYVLLRLCDGSKAASLCETREGCCSVPLLPSFISWCSSLFTIVKGKKKNPTSTPPSQRDQLYHRPMSSATHADPMAYPRGLPPQEESSVLSKRIVEELQAGSYECTICSDLLQRHDGGGAGTHPPLWSCRQCYGIFHLACMRRWTASFTAQREQQMRSASQILPASEVGKTRCPLCSGYAEMSTLQEYRCYCGKQIEPKYDAMLPLGSCGEVCGKARGPHCPHLCTQMCHPGSCGVCAVARRIECYCGKSKQHQAEKDDAGSQPSFLSKSVLCSSPITHYSCGEVCGKLLSCGLHTCKKECHEGPCGACAVTYTTACHCGGTTRSLQCGTSQWKDGYSCGKPCGKKKLCGHHSCGSVCHPGPCPVCPRLPALVRYCPCGKMRLPPTEGRQQCTDPIPTCGLPCERELPCGHRCQRMCHDDADGDGGCPPCSEVVVVPCRCGHTELAIPCFTLYLDIEKWEAASIETGLHPSCRTAAAAGGKKKAKKKGGVFSGRQQEEEQQVKVTIPTAPLPPLCSLPCRKSLSCHRHRCTEVCCVDVEHICSHICSKKLGCGVHQCLQLCHAGPCRKCEVVSYERLYCRCGKSFVEPPVPCGVKPPACLQACCVPRPCGHPANHPCHPEGTDCTECVYLVEKLCASHQAPMPYFLPCSRTEVTCGKRCAKKLECCGAHCEKACHPGPCDHTCRSAYPVYREALLKGTR